MARRKARRARTAKKQQPRVVRVQTEGGADVPMPVSSTLNSRVTCLSRSSSSWTLVLVPELLLSDSTRSTNTTACDQLGDAQ